MVFQSVSEVGAFGGVKVCEPGPQCGQVDPEFFGDFDQHLGPSECLAERADVDQPAGDGGLNGGFFSGCEPVVVGDWAAVDVFEFVGDGASPFGLRQVFRESDLSGSEVDFTHERR